MPDQDFSPRDHSAELIPVQSSASAQADGRFFPRLGRFIVATFKLGLAFGVGLVVLAGIVTAFVLANQKHQENERQQMLKPLRKVKNWPASEVLESTHATIQTKWDDNQLLVRMTLSNVPSDGFTFQDGANFILRFMDSDGFNVIEHTIPTRELARNVEADKVTGYQWQGSVLTSPEAYAKASTWTMLWSGVQQPKPTPTALSTDPSPIERWKTRANWRKLRSGMHQGEVRRLLGDPSYVEVQVYQYWVYGGRNWALYPHVRFLEGAVDGWQEP